MRLLRWAAGDRRQALRGGRVATVAVDALGADRGVAEVVAGALEAAAGGTRCLLFGPGAEIRRALEGRDAGAPGDVEVIDAPEGISNHEEPAQAVRSRPEASIVQAAKAVAGGRAQALVSAGSTGAALAASLLYVKRLRGVYRPALAVLVPVPGRPVLMLDVGASLEVRPEQLVQFGFMGAAFCERLLGAGRPRVGLLSVGEEPEKGTADVVAAHEQLAALRAPPFDFVGNVEGGGLTAGEADVVITDGFTGNVALKLMEGTTRTVVGAIRDAIRSGTLSKMGGLLIRSRLGNLRAQLDPEAVGGAYLLGLRGLVVVCHGASSRRAVASAIGLARRGVEQDVTGQLAAALDAAGVTRGGTATAGGPDTAEGDPPSVDADSVRIVR